MRQHSSATILAEHLFANFLTINRFPSVHLMFEIKFIIYDKVVNQIHSTRIGWSTPFTNISGFILDLPKLSILQSVLVLHVFLIRKKMF